MERIRPPYRPDDDIPFKAKGWRILAALFSIFVGLGSCVLVFVWVRSVLGGFNMIMIYLIILFFIIISPLVFAIWHYVSRNDDQQIKRDRW